MLLPRDGQIDDDKIFVRWNDGGVHSSIEGNLALVTNRATGGQGVNTRARAQADDLTEMVSLVCSLETKGKAQVTS